MRISKLFDVRVKPKRTERGACDLRSVFLNDDANPINRSPRTNLSNNEEGLYQRLQQRHMRGYKDSRLAE
jgi:hypothetical protein